MFPASQGGPTVSTHQPILKLGPRDIGRKVSPDEFLSADFEEPWTYERVEGRLVVVAPPGEEHVSYSEPWRDRLVVYKLQNPGIVQFVVSEAWLRVDGGTDRIGDLGVYLAQDQPVPRIPDRVPEIMFEVVSPDRRSRSRDYVEKRADYHRAGVVEYVVIDRFTRRVTVLTHTPAGYDERILTPTDTYTSPLLPGLEIPLSEVL